MVTYADKHAQSNRPTDHEFMFATGIENSYPTIHWQGKTVRRDGMEMSGHYQRWEEDFDLVKGMGIRFLRYGPPLYKTYLGRGRYDWDFADKTFARLRKLQIHPITDLCHFGVPDWVGDFTNPEFPELFAEYARAFAKRFNWVKLYTPVNEIFIAAEFSGRFGWWNECERSNKGFLTALRHLVKANILAEEAILTVQPEATFIQSESSSYYHQASPAAHHRAYVENQRRFLSLDLCYGNDISALTYEYLLDNGMSRAEFHWFMEHGRALTSRCIMGNDYYKSNEYLVRDNNSIPGPSGEVFGYYVITHQYFDRYRLPVMHTETNTKEGEEQSARWLHKEWANVVQLKHDGVPIMGFTWYSLIDQTDWDVALREINDRTNPCGLFDKNRKPHAVGLQYRELIREWRDRLPREALARYLHLEPDALSVHDTPAISLPPVAARSAHKAAGRSVAGQRRARSHNGRK
ncbi:MAG TPA: family 1 glycosylhydrolase [Tepidisphaeraceae bacterium]|jgi:beta-glucosidase/6-phospho-beta-glucosidase/beta-galactosidase|nr:family 1 glycosylhydrolase [Tepidisphaeraceae bacterium]